MNTRAKFILPSVLVALMVLATALPKNVNADFAATSAISDAAIREDTPDLNWGGHGWLWAGSFGVGGIARSLVKFDLSSIPAGSTINSAYLSLVVGAITGVPIGASFTVYRVTHDWVEGLGFGEDKDGVTWNEAIHLAASHPGSCTDWTDGGEWTLEDAASASLPPVGNWMTWTVTGIVKDWVEGGESNYGFIIRYPDGETASVMSVVNFYSRLDVAAMLEVYWSPWSPPRPVGGVLTPTNKLDVLAPYLALVGLVGAVTVAVAVTRRRKT